MVAKGTLIVQQGDQSSAVVMSFIHQEKFGDPGRALGGMTEASRGPGCSDPALKSQESRWVPNFPIFHILRKNGITALAQKTCEQVRSVEPRAQSSGSTSSLLLVSPLPSPPLPSPPPLPCPLPFHLSLFFLLFTQKCNTHTQTKAHKSLHTQLMYFQTPTHPG